MQITRLILKNWRNFRNVDVPLDSRTYLIGANASGKSNFLDVFRFIRDICKTSGGGLQKAIDDRGGITRLRCLEARQDSEIRIEIHLSNDPSDEEPVWKYALAFKTKGKSSPQITEEIVHHNGKEVRKRPDNNDRTDPLRLTQTHLEQINNNQEFREISEHFQDLTYLHLVPQLLKHAREINGQFMDNDPFGQGLLQQIAGTAQKTRDARLKLIQQVLSRAVPQFSELRFCKDEVSGLPHLEACYQHWRPNGAWQREEQFSDGTLRLIGLLWALQENKGLLLLEEPELSLNDAIVGQIPLMIDRVLRKRRVNRQVIISTHSETLLSQLGTAENILLLEPGADGTRIRPRTPDEELLMEAGLNPAEVLLPKTHINNPDQLGLL